MTQSCITTFYTGPASDNEAELVIRGPNCRSSCPRSIPLYTFKKFAQMISVVISKLCNAAIADGQFPEILKVARVMKIFKDELRVIISILSLYRGFFSNIFEKPKCIRLNYYL